MLKNTSVTHVTEHIVTHVTYFDSVFRSMNVCYNLEINDLTRFNKIAIQLIQARAQVAADKESTEIPH